MSKQLSQLPSSFSTPQEPVNDDCWQLQKMKKILVDFGKIHFESETSTSQKDADNKFRRVVEGNDEKMVDWRTLK